MKTVRPKRIAIIRGANLNKFEMQTYEMLSKDFDITAFCLKGNNFSLKDIKLPIKQLWGLDNFVPQFLRRYYYFAFGFIFETNQPMFGLSKRLKQFDIVHSSDVCYYYTYQAAKFKSKHGYKLVLTLFENIPFLFGNNPFSRKRVEEIIQNTDMFLPVTQRAAETMILRGIGSDRIRVIPPGVNTEVFSPKEEAKELYYKKFCVSKESMVILYVGRLSKLKGMLQLVYAAKRLFQDKELKDKNIKFILVGSGPLKKRIEALLNYLEIANDFRIVGGIDYYEMPAIYSIADIFVLPSVPTYRCQEQFGMVLIESMACGKPVISTLSGSIPEVVGDAGLLVQPGDHYSLYQALKRLILDENLRAELAGLARKRVLGNFDSRLVAEQIKKVYQSL